mgnify:CR=1 FL=1
MAHTSRDKQKIINRIRRIRGQLDAVETALEHERDCSVVLQNIAACRGAINGLMAEVLEGHIRHHIVDPDRDPESAQADAVRELIDVIKTYLK